MVFFVLFVFTVLVLVLPFSAFVLAIFVMVRAPRWNGDIGSRVVSGGRYLFPCTRVVACLLRSGALSGAAHPINHILGGDKPGT